jgi:hypothetical protein
MLSTLAFACCLVLPATAQDTAIPALNQRIVDHVRAQEGKKVGRGECWDLAAEALNTAGARWDGFYGFGTVVDWRKDAILPGDIVQFDGVQVEKRTDKSITRESFMKHTAVVVVVHGKGRFTLAHQNFGRGARTVSLHELAMTDVRTGKLTFYRPVE